MSEDQKVPIDQLNNGEGGSSSTPDAAQKNLLQIRVSDNNTEVFFRVKKDTPLRRVFEGFCKRTGKDYRSLRFLYEGERISEDDTPASLEMEEGDVIEAANQQVGGATC